MEWKRGRAASAEDTTGLLSERGQEILMSGSLQIIPGGLATGAGGNGSWEISGAQWWSNKCPPSGERVARPQ